MNEAHREIIRLTLCVFFWKP